MLFIFIVLLWVVQSLTSNEVLKKKKTKKELQGQSEVIFWDQETNSTTYFSKIR